MINRYNKLTQELVKIITYKSSQDNIILSPLSLLMLLLIAAESTGGSTRDEIADFLLPGATYEQVRESLLKINKDLTEEPALKSANAVCVKHDLAKQIKRSYVKAIEKEFGGEVFTSRDIVSDVNSWVKKATKGMIPQVADDSMRTMIACLINAVAFEAEWVELYYDDDVWTEEFHDFDGGTSEVEMLHSQEYGYIENHELTGFTKPYKGGGFSYMALLPKKKGKHALYRMIKDLDWANLYFRRRGLKVDITMPEFKHDFGIDLTSLLQDMGVGECFTENADFSPMTDAWLKINKIIHKAHIEVDRKGTKAAAVTMAEIVLGCLPPQNAPKVILDRPFVYAIIHDETKLPVFVGVVEKV